METASSIAEAGLEKWINFSKLHLSLINKYDNELDAIRAKPNSEPELEDWEEENRDDYNRRIDQLIVGSLTCIHMWNSNACYLGQRHYDFGKHTNRQKEFRPQFYAEVRELLLTDKFFTVKPHEDL